MAEEEPKPKKDLMGRISSEDWDLMGQAEDKATGADIHLVRGMTCSLSGYLDMPVAFRKEYADTIERWRKCLRLYVNGMSMRAAMKETGGK